MYHVLTSFWTQYVLAMLVKRALERNPPKTITKENLQKISSDLEVGGARQPLWWKVIRSGAAVNGSIHHVYIFNYSCSHWLFLTCSSGYCEKSKTAVTLQLYQQSVWEPDMLKVTQSSLPSIDPILLQYSSSDPVPQTGLTTGYTPPHEKTTNFVNNQL